MGCMPGTNNVSVKRLLRYTHHHPCGFHWERSISSALVAPCSNRSAILVIVRRYKRATCPQKSPFFCRFFCAAHQATPLSGTDAHFFMPQPAGIVSSQSLSLYEKLAHRGVGRINRIPAGEGNNSYIRASSGTSGPSALLFSYVEFLPRQTPGSTSILSSCRNTLLPARSLSAAALPVCTSVHPRPRHAERTEPAITRRQPYRRPAWKAKRAPARRAGSHSLHGRQACPDPFVRILLTSAALLQEAHNRCSISFARTGSPVFRYHGRCPCRPDVNSQ